RFKRRVTRFNRKQGRLPCGMKAPPAAGISGSQGPVAMVQLRLCRRRPLPGISRTRLCVVIRRKPAHPHGGGDGAKKMRVPGDRWRDRTAAQGATAEGKVGGMLRVGLSLLLELKQDSSPPQFRTSMLSLRREA